MKDISLLIKETDDAGMIYDPWTTSTIISYEAGYVLRNMFYAMNTGESDREIAELKGHLANARIETADLIMQTRVLAHVCGWGWDTLVSDGEAKLLDRAETYRKRGVKPRDRMLARVGRAGWLKTLFSLIASRDAQPSARTGD